MPTATSPPATSYRLVDPHPLTEDISAVNLDRMLREGPPHSVSLIDFAADLLELMTADSTFEVLTPDALLARADDPAYADTVDRLAVRLGQQGCWLVDTDLIVRETDRGYPVAIIWVCDTVADDAERIAYWAGRFGLATAGDLLLCVMTPDCATTYPTAECERKAAAMQHAVDRVYWLGPGHPTSPNQTRLADLPRDLESTRASVLCL